MKQNSVETELSFLVYEIIGKQQILCQNVIFYNTYTAIVLTTVEPPHGKTNNVVFEQVRHIPGCTGTADSKQNSVETELSFLVYEIIGKQQILCQNVIFYNTYTAIVLTTVEPPHGKTNNVVFEQVRHIPGCTGTADSKNLEILDSIRGTGIVLSK